jgi:hypothetical protein
VETISKQRESTIKNEIISSNDSPDLKREESIRRTKPILYKLYNKCKEDANSLNNFNRTENDVMEVKTKRFNLYSYKSEQMNKKLRIPKIMEIKVMPKVNLIKQSPRMNSIEIS